VRLFDTRITHTVVSAAQPFAFSLPGHGGVPSSGATAVQLALTILIPSTSGVMQIRTGATVGTTTSSISYRAGVTTTVMVSAPVISSPAVVFTPSAGIVNLVADVMGYSGQAGQNVAAVAPTLVGSYASVPTGNGVAVPVRAAAGASATAVVLRVSARSTPSGGWLRLWSSGAPPNVTQATIKPNMPNTATVIVPIGPGGTVQLAAQGAGLATNVTLVGVIASAATRLLESYQTEPLQAAGETAIPVTSAVSSVTVLGTPPIPAAGVSAVLVAVTVTPGASSGSLFAWAAGAARPAVAIATFGGSVVSTVTTMVAVGAGGKINLQTTGQPVHVAIDTTGYLTG
jgi:hypothetical protein